MNIELYLKLNFLTLGVGVITKEAYNWKWKTNTYGCSRLLDVLATILCVHCDNSEFEAEQTSLARSVFTVSLKTIFDCR